MNITSICASTLCQCSSHRAPLQMHCIANLSFNVTTTSQASGMCAIMLCQLLILKKKKSHLYYLRVSVQTNFETDLTTVRHSTTVIPHAKSLYTSMLHKFTKNWCFTVEKPCENSLHYHISTCHPITADVTQSQQMSPNHSKCRLITRPSR